MGRGKGTPVENHTILTPADEVFKIFEIKKKITTRKHNKNETKRNSTFLLPAADV